MAQMKQLQLVLQLSRVAGSSRSALDQHGVIDAAECIEKGSNLLMQASWKAKKSCCPN